MAVRRFWTIIETHGDNSRRAVHGAEAIGFECYHPEYRGPRVNHVRRTLPLFPAYAFVRASRDNVVQLHRVKDVKRVYRLESVDQSFVDKIKSFENRFGYVDVERMLRDEAFVEFVPGQLVMGIRGLMNGHLGEFVSYDDEEGFAGVRMSILGGREVVFHVDAGELIAA